MSMKNEAGPRERFGLRMGNIARLWRARIDLHLAVFGLTEARWRTLLHLSRADKGFSQTDLALASSVRGPTLVRTLDWLESEGLIERRGVRGDLRKKVVHITPKARPILRQIQAVVEKVRQDIFFGVADDDLITCLKVFAQLTRALEGGSSDGADADTDAAMQSGRAK